MKTFKKKIKKSHIFLISAILVFSLTVGACAIYLGDYYRADLESVEAFLSVNEVEYYENKSGDYVFEPEVANAGFIFYPGGKVEVEAYLPLMAKISSMGILCVAVKMPFNLAVFDINAAEGIKEAFPNIENWYIGGHSLGGSMAAEYISNHSKGFDGLILLGSYSTSNLSESSIKVLSVYGSEDGVLNREKYSKNLSNLPLNFKEIIIDGGCHAYFGVYGEQEGDGIAKISVEKQVEISANAIIDFIK